MQCESGGGKPGYNNWRKGTKRSASSGKRLRGKRSSRWPRPEAKCINPKALSSTRIKLGADKALSRDGPTAKRAENFGEDGKGRRHCKTMKILGSRHAGRKLVNKDNLKKQEKGKTHLQVGGREEPERKRGS